MLKNTRNVCVLFALPEEARPFVREIGNLDTSRIKGIYESYRGMIPYKPHPIDLTVAVSGVGQQNAAHCAEAILDSLAGKIDILIISGFAGHLEPVIHFFEGFPVRSYLGNVIVVSDVITETQEKFRASPALFEAASNVSADAMTVESCVICGGPLITGDRVLITPQEKSALAERTGAIAVDMETAGAVRVAQERGIPWLAVRAITDGVNDELPLDFNALANSDGSVNRGRILRATLAQPHKIPALIRLGQRSSLAANNLAAFLVAFLQTLPEGF